MSRATVGPVKSSKEDVPTDGRTRTSFPEAARTLLRDTVLDAVRALLVERDWSKITLSDVATQAGVSRQTLYNEFGSRSGLAEAYAIRLADNIVDQVEKAVWANVGQARAALADAFNGLLVETAMDPLVQSLLTGEAKLDLLRLVTLDSAPILSRAATRLSAVFQRSWIGPSPDEAEILSRAVVRLAMSYVSMPREFDRDLAADFAALLGPYVDAVEAAGNGNS